MTTRTNNQVLSQALVEMGVLAEGDVASGDKATAMLEQLNQMMATWPHQNEIDIDWFRQDSINDSCPVPDDALAAVISSLAVYAASSQRVPVTQEMVAKANVTTTALRTHHINLALTGADMQLMPRGRSGRYSIDSDTI